MSHNKILIMSLQECVYSTLDTDGRLLSTYLPRLCLDIRFATQVSPFVSSIDSAQKASGKPWCHGQLLSYPKCPHRRGSPCRD